jgi:hypothetical protein
MIWELRCECLMMMVNKNLTELSWIFFKNLILILIEQRNHSFSIFFPFTNIIRLVDLICLSWIYGFETMQKTAKAMLWTHAMHWIDVQVKYAVVKKKSWDTDWGLMIYWCILCMYCYFFQAKWIFMKKINSFFLHFSILFYVISHEHP